MSEAFTENDDNRDEAARPGDDEPIRVLVADRPEPDPPEMRCARALPTNHDPPPLGRGENEAKRKKRPTDHTSTGGPQHR